MVALEACSNPHGHIGNLALNEGEEMGQTVGQLITPYIKDRTGRGLYGPRTARTARGNLHRFAAYVGQRRIKNIGAVHIEGWLASLEHLAPATRRSYLSTVRQFFAWSVRHRHCKRNPATDVDAPRQPRSVPRALPQQSIARVLEHCPDGRGLLIVTLMVQQGLRCVEIHRLTMGDLDWNHNTMRVRGKGNHERILPILPETREAIDQYLDEHPASAGPLVRSYVQPHRPLSADTISYMTIRWMYAAGVKKRARDGVSGHAGRHTCATDMLRGGAHLRDVQTALGHAHLQTTEIYLPLLVNGLSEAMGGRTYRGEAGPGSGHVGNLTDPM